MRTFECIRVRGELDYVFEIPLFAANRDLEKESVFARDLFGTY